MEQDQLERKLLDSQDAHNSRTSLESSILASEEHCKERLLEKLAKPSFDELREPGQQTARGTTRRTRDFHLGPVLKAILIASITAAVLLLLQQSPALWSRQERCANGNPMRTRREWRSLKRPQQAAYISAIQCLNRLPSELHPHYPKVSRWHDFPWTHYKVGYIAHDAACFLSWHRWFLVLFENTLRETCGYTGPLPYWDWTLDWEHPEHAPVFDNMYGFGGNGNPNSSWCVEDGPFANERIPFDEAGTYVEQGECLSRKFALGNTFNGSHLSPEHVKEVLSKDGYYEMLMALERGPHNDIPLGLQGTFITLYAPTDPIFYLHHAQLDRLWWIWQNAQPSHAKAYDGLAFADSTEDARLDDVLPFGNLSEDVVVKDILDTKSGTLCYEYDKAKV